MQILLGEVSPASAVYRSCAAMSSRQSLLLVARRPEIPLPQKSHHTSAQTSHSFTCPASSASAYCSKSANRPSGRPIILTSDMWRYGPITISPSSAVRKRRSGRGPRLECGFGNSRRPPGPMIQPLFSPPKLASSSWKRSIDRWRPDLRRAKTVTTSAAALATCLTEPALLLRH
jgi:hypothetical protein